MPTTRMEPAHGDRRTLAVWSFVAGLIADFGVVMIALSTYTAAGSALEPPNWLRAITLPLFPLGAIASVILGIPALRRDGRRLAIAGLVLTALAIVGFVVMIASVDY